MWDMGNQPGDDGGGPRPRSHPEPGCGRLLYGKANQYGDRHANKQTAMTSPTHLFHIQTSGSFLGLGLAKPVTFAHPFPDMTACKVHG
ncbi:hypothetical protein GGTG_12998 [Gaeumannomyces tritici R3-111a-1]|uniref:Uncharacterized protein n=1 Tax=Gaeumannomyces tritici (strain R3-111a-1) TaxID=644352 RepID=J3PHL8_GAET3|nr:hypothetical protein GGTG_12998 [Gaeumannomyces tritici R3-111a-1]EJT69379.1 hypothetical protein GGTG_12998 [Gaeumannomyces tritici R3-111a-1]